MPCSSTVGGLLGVTLFAEFFPLYHHFSIKMRHSIAQFECLGIGFQDHRGVFSLFEG
jgi:hypothetical protein